MVIHYYVDHFREDIIEDLLLQMKDYVDTHPKDVSEPNFHEEFEHFVKEGAIEVYCCHHIENSSPVESFFNMDGHNIDKEQEDEEYYYFMELLHEAFCIFYDTIYPRRSHIDTFVSYEQTSNLMERNERTIHRLKETPQPKQRTNEWYEFRHNLITASNAYKAFESEKVVNSLIYEKCLPKTVASVESECNVPVSVKMVNVDTTLHWGQKFEPLSVMYYEKIYHTKVDDFGCIQHNKYSFLGASPDGINVDKSSDRYGRMLEIKNIVNREIDGVPKKEYWIQMQLQMETCDLDECDFLETQFKEYESWGEYKEDVVEPLLTEQTTKHPHQREVPTKGVILYFANPKEGVPVYVYKPIMMDEEMFEIWEQQQMEEQEKAGNVWIRNIYWKLEIFSCVLVERNRMWFEANIGRLEEVWRTIEKERVEGYEHRKPATVIPRKKKDDFVVVNKCMISIDVKNVDCFTTKMEGYC
jgi:putative phage-type endonuclease